MKRTLHRPAHYSGCYALVQAMSNGRKKHAKSLGYTKALVEPIVKKKMVVYRGLPANNEQHFDPEEVIQDEFFGKIHKLAEHYGTDIGTDTLVLEEFWTLFVRVLTDWVPGFEVREVAPRRQGAPVKNDTQSLDLLVREIDAIRSKNPKWTKKRACEAFLMNHKSERRWANLSTRTVVNTYTNAKAGYVREVNMVRALLKRIAEGGGNLVSRPVSAIGSQEENGLTSTQRGLFSLGARPDNAD